MFKRYSVIGVLSLMILLIILLSDVNSQKNWYIFHPQKAITNLAPVIKNSYYLDAPAGKHGFVIVKNGHFYFEDGTPVKFWGVNLVFGACFPDHHQAEKISKLLASLGVNLVRLHSMDRWLEPNGIWDKNDPKKISSTQLDKLDYFIYCLKKEGIYIDLNLLVTRDFSKINKKFSGLALGGKPACLFDPYLIKLQKEYAKGLLLHFNPYTKTIYNNEPAIAFIEIVNECSIFHYWFMGILDGFPRHGIRLSYYFRNQLDILWRNWLIKKYGSITNIPWNVNFNKNQQKLKRPLYMIRFLYPKSEVKDLIRFYYDLEKRYFFSMKSYLKRELKVKSLILTTNFQYCLLNLILQQEISDYLDFHREWDHPQFLDGKWDLKHFKFTNKNPLEEEEKNWIKIFSKALVFGKPLMVSEWGVNNFNRYAYIVPLLFTTYASILDVDGLIAFNFWNKRFSQSISYISDFFSFKNNPQRLVLFVPCGMIFLNQLVKLKIFFKKRFYTFENAVDHVYKYSRKIPMPFFIHNNNYFIFQKYSFSSNKNTKHIELIEDKYKDKYTKIVWDSINKIFKVEGKYVYGVTGVLSNIDTIIFKYLKIRSKTNGTVILIPLDKKPIIKSKKLLLTIVGKVKNSNSVWSKRRFILGNFPVVLKSMKTKVKLDFLKKFYLIPISHKKEKKHLYKSYHWINLANFNTPWFIIEKIN